MKGECDFFSVTNCLIKANSLLDVELQGTEKFLYPSCIWVMCFPNLGCVRKLCILGKKPFKCSHFLLGADIEILLFLVGRAGPFTVECYSVSNVQECHELNQEGT